MAINRHMLTVGFARLGIISSSNPDDSTIKVKIQPEDVETGFIPYATPWIGWYAPPNIGDQCLVIYQEGSKNVPIGALLLYWNNSRPPSGVKQTEAILKHTSGSFIKLTEEGKILINGQTEINVTTPKLVITTSGDIEATAGGVVNIESSEINLGVAANTVRTMLNELFINWAVDHTHPAPGGETGVPTQPIPASVTTSNVKAS